MPDTVTIGLVSTSDRASGGIYPDEGIPSASSRPSFPTNRPKSKQR